jgi:hypothetical protein
MRRHRLETGCALEACFQPLQAAPSHRTRRRNGGHGAAGADRQSRLQRRVAAARPQRTWRSRAQPCLWSAAARPEDSDTPPPATTKPGANAAAARRPLSARRGSRDPIRTPTIGRRINRANVARVRRPRYDAAAGTATARSVKVRRKVSRKGAARCRRL